MKEYWSISNVSVVIANVRLTDSRVLAVARAFINPILGHSLSHIPPHLLLTLNQYHVFGFAIKYKCFSLTEAYKQWWADKKPVLPASNCKHLNTNKKRL